MSHGWVWESQPGVKTVWWSFTSTTQHSDGWGQGFREDTMSLLFSCVTSSCNCYRVGGWGAVQAQTRPLLQLLWLCRSTPAFTVSSDVASTWTNESVSQPVSLAVCLSVWAPSVMVSTPSTILLMKSKQHFIDNSPFSNQLSQTKLKWFSAAGKTLTKVSCSKQNRDLTLEANYQR